MQTLRSPSFKRVASAGRAQGVVPGSVAAIPSVRPVRPCSSHGGDGPAQQHADDQSFRGQQSQSQGRFNMIGALDTWEFGGDDGWMPAPMNTPTTQEPLLYPPRAAVWKATSMPGIDLLAAGAGAVSNMAQVYVILFGVGGKDTEGIYSLRAFSEDGLPQETIIVFEAEEDAIRYAGLLEATMTHEPSVCSIPPGELLDFCVDSGYQCRMEPAGSLLIPPDFNVGVTDWERSQRLREGRWAVLDSEPEASGQQRMWASGATSVQELAPWAMPQHMPTNRPPRSMNPMSEEELGAIRARLEMLLPPADEPGQE